MPFVPTAGGRAMSHPALASGSVAVVTGGASGIGLAAATRFAEAGMRVCIADLGGEPLDKAVEGVRAAATGGPSAVIGIATDVSRLDDIRRLESQVNERF